MGYTENMMWDSPGLTGLVTVECDVGYFINSIKSSPGHKLYNLEELNCCRYDPSKVQLLDDHRDSDSQHGWWDEFGDVPASTVLVDTDEYICGLQRTAGEPHELYQLEAASTRRL